MSGSQQAVCSQTGRHGPPWRLLLSRLWWPPAVRRRCSPRWSRRRARCLATPCRFAIAATAGLPRRYPPRRSGFVRNRSRRTALAGSPAWSCRLPSVRRSPPCYPVRPPATGRGSPACPGGKQSSRAQTRPVRLGSAAPAQAPATPRARRARRTPAPRWPPRTAGRCTSRPAGSAAC
ncbi:Uncharacterised protein [Mycobacterium tuberculosis]|nr:Uncharacterised protein [Mycobacterium tuberculosis]CKT49287.1 Uncharacterised protein [Mycobacterium tuberculosis]